ncbi:MAG: hypothetical protein H0V82_04425 [Candidatus Protochlamydia sp.]|nr:hypothetical protein [Candidatus Protochlamydia sp.]
MSKKSDYSPAAEKTKTKEATWPDFAVGLYDKLSGRGSKITYKFDDLNIFIPSKLGEDSDHFHWRMDGSIQISSEDEVNSNENEE